MEKIEFRDFVSMVVGEYKRQDLLSDPNLVATGLGETLASVLASARDEHIFSRVDIGEHTLLYQRRADGFIYYSLGPKIETPKVFSAVP